MKFPRLHRNLGVGLAAAVWILPLSLTGSLPIPPPPQPQISTLAAPLEFCQGLDCVSDNTYQDQWASSCGDNDEWALGFYDDRDGYMTVDYEYATTACNPTDQIDNEYQLCTNQGTVANPDWGCTEVDPAIMDPPQPEVIVHPCGMLEWDVDDEDDVGPGGSQPGTCSSVGCTTTDDFQPFFRTEYDYDLTDPANACYY